MIDGEMSSIAGLATVASPSTVDNKVPDISNLVRTTDYDTKVLDIDPKYVTTPDRNKCTKNKLDARIENKKVVNESGISLFINNSDLNEKIRTLPIKAELGTKQDEIVKLQTYDSSFFLSVIKGTFSMIDHKIS